MLSRPKARYLFSCSALASASAGALLCLVELPQLRAQGAAEVVSLPTVRVTARRARRPAVRSTSAGASRFRPAPAGNPAPASAAVATADAGASGSAGAPGANFPVGSGGAEGANVGYVATRTSTATRTDTPLINVPQSVSVVTKEFIRDQAFGSISDVVRYVPGVTPHQGESNRDQVVIRGQSTTADFFVDGVRDDAQYFRDLYNTARIEVLKGPNAMIFGRGGGGGVINRVLKDANGVPVHEVLLQGGQFKDGRVALDVSDAVTDTLAARFNAVYENTASYRRFVNIERYGLNPTATWAPNANTRVRLAYEYFHDDRVTDRGIPSQFGRPFPTDPSTFFGNPNLNRANVDAHILTGVIEHDFENGLKLRNISRYANYDKFYQNVFPGGPVNAAGTSVPLSAYNNRNDRENLFNQTDLTYKIDGEWIRHTLLFGAEVGRQNSDNFRQTGFFNGTATSINVPTWNPVSVTPVVFRNNGTTDANGHTAANLAAVYAQDQVEITRYLQFIGGIRFDRFDLAFHDNRTGANLNRVDDLASPRAGVVVKPIDTLSLYTSYSVSYLPSAGDQFGTLAANTVFLKPEKFTNKEAGVKWEPLPNLQFNAAVYDLLRENTRANDPNNPGFFVPTGATRTRGFETGVSGYLTKEWQIVGGYAYTDARIAQTTSAAPAGNRVALVPTDTFSLWNKYQITQAWGVGVGVIHQTGMFAAVDNAVRLPGFTRVDAAVYGRLAKNLRWQINIENVFDRRYIATADGNNNITPGSPRAVRGTLVASF